MIECSTQNIYYKKGKKRKKNKRILPFLIIVSLLIGVFFYYKKIVEPFVADLAFSYLEMYSTQSVNSAVLNMINDAEYKDLVTVEKNSDGDIIMVSTDSFKASTLNRQIALSVQNSLQDKLGEGINLPLLAFSGIKFLSGYGFPVNLKTINVVSVICDFKDVFSGAGINQTIHSLYLNVKTTASVKIPMYSKTEENVTSVLLTESIIIGKVPEVIIGRN